VYGSFGGGGVAGVSFDQISAPQLPGVAGGASANGALGGLGGGALQVSGEAIVISGTVRMEGLPGAQNGSQYGGGGSGGALNFVCNRFWGDGLLSVAGGPGQGLYPGSGGGGGGGLLRICAASSEVFTGGKELGGAPSSRVTATPGMGYSPPGKLGDCNGLVGTPAPNLSITVTPTAPATAAAPQAGLIGPVPLPKGRPLCLSSAGSPHNFDLTLYNISGERVATMAGNDPCVQTQALAPGIYYVWVKATMGDGSSVDRWQKIVIAP
jgi:hypothetical protein